MNSYLTILIGAILVNNFVMNKFLGCCPFLGVSKRWIQLLAWAWL